MVGGGGKSSTVFRIGRDLAAAGYRAVITHTARIAAFQTAWAPAVIEVDSDATTLPYAQIAAALDTHGVCLLTGPVVADRRAGLPPHLINRLVIAAPQLGLHAISIEADGSKMRPAKAPAAHEPVLPHSTTILSPMLGLDAVGAEIDDRLFHRAELVRRFFDLPSEDSVRFTPRMAASLLTNQRMGAKDLPLEARLLPILNKADHPLRLLYGRLTAARLARWGHPSLLAAAGQGEGEPVVERWGTLATVILAAGASTRFGRPKQFEPVAGEPLLLRALRVAAGLPGPVYLVTGAYAEQVLSLLYRLPGSLDAALLGIKASPAERAPAGGLAAALAGRLHVVHNPHWAQGQASSLHASVRALPAQVEAAIWLPVDQPYLDAALLARLAAAWRRGADLAAPLADGEVRGAPALFDRSRWPALLQVEGDAGGRAVLRRFAHDVVTVPAEAASLRDIDYPDDLRE